MPLMLTATQGDTLDALLWRETGLGADALPVVLDANPGLADLGPVLPVGIGVAVPDLRPGPSSLPLIQLWD
ncbi:tail protein X [Pedomonas mirosovicensis]|uniref:tail protein X n=1 Tax=Pedomonas mirosovicensis TaxID=2908641 RepID=UPI002168CAEA|nr:tail protein X [Pedomonas mirosovicensis]MCH8686469.1 tail protein X [Pedomonas mirosovicensis]